MSESGPPADWYPDPAGLARHRYWDGTGWTMQTIQPLPDGRHFPAPAVEDRGRQTPQASDAPAAAEPKPKTASPGGERDRTTEGHLILTDRVERMTEIEDRLGVTLDHLFAVFVADEDYPEVVVLGDVTGEARSLRRDVEVVVTAFNEKGQVKAREDTYVWKDEYVGIHPFKLTLEVKSPPAKLRLMVKGS